MPNYRYRALNANGELVSGAIAAPAPGDVALRVERLGLVLVDNVTLEEGGSARRAFGIFGKPRAEDVTLFTRDLALLLRAGARINDGLELLAQREIELGDRRSDHRTSARCLIGLTRFGRWPTRCSQPSYFCGPARA